MQFIVLGFDGKDKDAPRRRSAMREAHIKLGEELRLAGNMWYGAALTNEDGEMNGSMIFVDFPNREKLQEWLDKEPYITGNVWQEIKILPCKVRDPWQFNRPQEFFESRRV